MAVPGGPAFVGRSQRVWDRATPLLPLDPACRRRAVDAPCRDGPGSRSSTDGGEQRLRRRPARRGRRRARRRHQRHDRRRPRASCSPTTPVAASAAATSARLGVDPARDRWLACLPARPRRRALGRDPGPASPARRSTVHAGFDADAVSARPRRGATLVSLVPTALARIDPPRFRAHRARRLGARRPACPPTSSSPTA